MGVGGEGANHCKAGPSPQPLSPEYRGEGLLDRTLTPGRTVFMHIFKCLVLMPFVLLAVWPAREKPSLPAVPNVVLAIHGGAGVLPKKEMTPEVRKKYGLTWSGRWPADTRHCRKDGNQPRRRGGGDPGAGGFGLFNAGKGAVFTHEGRNELDASIMEGKDKRAGAVAGVTGIKNPIPAAREVMEHRSTSCWSVGRGGAFAIAAGRRGGRSRLFLDEGALAGTSEMPCEGGEGAKRPGKRAKDHVAATAPRDGRRGGPGRQGNLAAGTSTGGMTNKRSGRVGDSPVIGAGTYADNAACAVSCTGHGESSSAMPWPTTLSA